MSRPPTHGERGSSEYGVWSSMWTRCTNKKHKSYGAYKGRAPPKRWRSFVNFLADMGRRPTPKHTLERINNNRPYGPTNCRWATWTEQNRNTPNLRWLTYGGRRMLLTDWAIELGVTRAALYYRIKHWGVKRALTTPRREQP